MRTAHPTPQAGNRHTTTLSAIVLALSLAYPLSSIKQAHAQTLPGVIDNTSGLNVSPEVNTPAQAGSNTRFTSIVQEDAVRDSANRPNVYIGSKSAANVNYGVNALVGEVQVEVERDAIPADGQTATGITVKVFDLKGQPLKDKVIVTVEVSGGRIQLAGAQTDELGPGRLDLDRSVPGTQLKVEQGVARFNLIAPITPQDVRLRITSGQIQAAGTISFVPALRDMLAVGMVEGVIRFRKNDGATLSPVRLDDGFEQELHRFERSFRDGKGSVAARTAIFLKGKISGDALLTAAYDSDKETLQRLVRDVKPEDFYPVYGDASIKGVEAKSSSKLYVRVDKDKSYLLFGDYVTSTTGSQIVGTGSVASVKLRDLGQYSRTLNGIRGHYENSAASLNVFAARDSLKQVIEEFAANGTSGPFAVRNGNALEGSEKIEIVIRDKNQPTRILDIISQTKLVDYVFEPFSGRILFKSAVSSLDISGNPQAIRITYEVDQGGQQYWVAGADGQVKLGKNVELGGSYVQDKNPNAPTKIASANIGFKLGDNATIVAEIAQTHTRRYAVPDANTGIVTNYALPTGALGEQAVDLSGKAYRVEGQYRTQTSNVRAYFARSDVGFDNPAASYTGGRGEMGVNARTQLNDTIGLYGQAIRSEDRTSGAKRTGADLGVSVKPTKDLGFEIGLRKAREEGGSNAAPVLSNSTLSGGGFYGLGTNAINGTTGTTILAANGALSTAGGAQAVNTTVLHLGARYKISDNLTLNGEFDKSFQGDQRRRVAAGVQYQIDERTKLYGRYEAQSGISTVYSGDKSNAFVFGADTKWLPNTQLFTEYRLRDASTDRDLQWSNGLRNSWELAEGVRVNSSAEYLQILSGTARNAAALSGGLDYTASENWKGSTKLEWRRLFDDKATVGKDTVDSWLSTVTLARKMSRDWTMLGRNYLLYTHNNQDATGAPKGNVMQDRFQLGFAYRPVDTNSFNALARYEYKLEKDLSIDPINTRRVHMFSAHGVYHPSRPVWFSARLAAKSVSETLDGTLAPRYTAMLISTRLVYDITENWDLGLMGSMMYSPQGQTRQYAVGLEVGYLVAQNLWLSAGYNFTGFSDKDLTGSDYTNKGAYMRMRWKFDEDLFSGKDSEVNRALPR